MVTNCRREKLSPEEAETEYVRSEKDCVFNWLKVEQWLKWHQNHFWGLESVHYKKTSEQMAQYGQTNPTDEEVL
jgi:trigger factor